MAIGNKMLLALFLAVMPVHFVSAAQTVQDALEALKKQDYQTALRILRPLAEQGDVQAQFNLGAMHEQGLGVPKNDAEAVNWFRKAAEQGFAGAQYLLGLMYHEGLGVPKNDVEAVN